MAPAEPRLVIPAWTPLPLVELRARHSRARITDSRSGSREQRHATPRNHRRDAGGSALLRSPFQCQPLAGCLLREWIDERVEGWGWWDGEDGGGGGGVGGEWVGEERAGFAGKKKREFLGMHSLRIDLD